MTYDEYEDVIVKRLEMPGVEVQTLPDLSALNAPRPTLVPIIYVMLDGAVFEDINNLSVVSNEETLNGELFFRARERRGEFGIFDLYEKACTRLLGYRPPHTKDGITLGQFGYVAGIQNNWQYFMSFSFTKVRVPADEPADTQLITGINNQFTFSQ